MLPAPTLLILFALQLAAAPPAVEANAPPSTAAEAPVADGEAAPGEGENAVVADTGADTGADAGADTGADTAADPEVDPSQVAEIVRAFEVIGGYDGVTVEERSGIILLRGEVASSAARRVAEEITTKVADPLYVANAIEVVVADEAEDDPSLAADEQDMALQAQLRSILSTVEALHGVRATVHASIVRLSGTTHDEEALDRTVKIASSLEGVLFVDNGVQVVTTARGQLEGTWRSLRARLNSLVGKLPILGLSLISLVVAMWLSRQVMRSSLSGRLFSRNPLLQTVARRILATLIAVAGIIGALDLMNATGVVGALLGTAGIVGLAVGFAFKDIVENYLAGILLAVSRPFEPKDAVRIGEWEGKVIRLSARETMLMTYDGNHLQIPNAEVFGSAVLNYTRNPKRRFDFIVGIGNGEDLSRAQQVANGALTAMPGVMDEPAPYTRLDGFGDSSMQLHFYGWVDQTSYDFTKVKSEAIRTIKRVMEENNIDLPNPITQIQLERTEPAPPKPKAKESAAPAHDLSVDHEIEAQIDAETNPPDLLSAAQCG